ncbi:hypothetical protein E4K73_25195 [Streptomyces sp. IB201691-2A2]|nr:hypothetical protein E4K73_25195 [Streptomyces sp. IB201691-2A2]
MSGSTGGCEKADSSSAASRASSGMLQPLSGAVCVHLRGPPVNTLRRADRWRDGIRPVTCLNTRL